MKRQTRWAAFILATQLLVGCSATATSLSTTGASWGRPTSNRPPSAAIVTGSDTVTVFHGGSATFTALRQLIDLAQASVDVEMYEFGRHDMRDALIRAHERGVTVTVIVDPSVDVTAATETQLRAAGIDVIDYPVRSMMIDHVKLLVVDSTVAVVGGINWGQSSERNHDVDALVRGPAATNLQRAFDLDLVTCGLSHNVPDAARDPALLVAATLPGIDIRPLALQVIGGATQTLDLELYVVTDSGVVGAIIAAAHRGVQVRVLLDPGERPSDPSAAKLRAAGVDVLLYRGNGEKLHAKLVVADTRTVLFGSANWSKSGFTANHEIDVEITNSTALAEDFEAAIDADWTASK